MGKMHKRLAKSIRKFGQYDDDAESLAAYLIARGWRDTEKRPKVQQVTVIPSPLLSLEAKSQGFCLSSFDGEGDGKCPTHRQVT